MIFKIKISFEYLKNNFLEYADWYDKNFKHLSPKAKRVHCKLLNIIANMKVLDINTERGYPKSWRIKYEGNIVELMNNLRELTKKEAEEK